MVTAAVSTGAVPVSVVPPSTSATGRSAPPSRAPAWLTHPHASRARTDALTPVDREREIQVTFGAGTLASSKFPGAKMPRWRARSDGQLGAPSVGIDSPERVVTRL